MQFKIVTSQREINGEWEEVSVMEVSQDQVMKTVEWIATQMMRKVTQMLMNGEENDPRADTPWQFTTDENDPLNYPR